MSDLSSSRGIGGRPVPALVVVASLSLCAVVGCSPDGTTDAPRAADGATAGDGDLALAPGPDPAPGRGRVVVEPGGGSDASASALDTSNADAVLEAVLDVVAGRVYDERFLTLRRVTDGLAPSSIETVLRSERDAYDIEDHDCPEGGTATLARRVEDAGEFDNAAWTFDGCVRDGHVLDGAAEELAIASGELRHRFDTLVLVSPRRHRAEIDGTLSRTVVDDWGGGEGLRRFEADGLTLVTVGPDVSVELREVRTSLLAGIVCPKSVGCYDSAAFDASFTLRSDALADGDELRVETASPFFNDGGRELRFDRGTLAVTADDGSAITLEADNGEPSSARVTVTTADGLTSAREVPWDTLAEPLAFVPRTSPEADDGSRTSDRLVAGSLR